ncbi:MAG: hypothetical protein NW224_27635 [Leptolyngbyaceae cyanobacterium bins.302]|nr:hypothetical protein [Leptolyngbyaceae cyanobacterium bins.302]
MNTPNYPSLTEKNSLNQSKNTSSLIARLNSVMTQFWNNIWDWIVTHDDPKVRERFDRQGRRIGWQVFDPETGYTISFGSELEVRLWLEHRYR